MFLYFLISYFAWWLCNFGKELKFLLPMSYFTQNIYSFYTENSNPYQNTWVINNQYEPKWATILKNSIPHQNTPVSTKTVNKTDFWLHVYLKDQYSNKKLGKTRLKQYLLSANPGSVCTVSPISALTVIWQPFWNSQWSSPVGTLIISLFIDVIQMWT